MSTAIQNSTALWQDVRASHQQYAKAMNDFLAAHANKTDVLRNALRTKDSTLALIAAPSLTIAEKQELLPEWIHVSRALHGPFQVAWNIILSLPREWLMQNIERYVDAILQDSAETDYWMFLQLYARLDDGLMRKLAQRAAAHTAPEIRELGEEYLAKPAASKP